jgi:ADP-ribose pyrophosphatase YjhB (NUDIX family)
MQHLSLVRGGGGGASPEFLSSAGPFFHFHNIHCNNCGKAGHSFHQCKLPITSFGVIAYRRHPLHGSLEYLMIRRKDTLGYVDFIRGKYSVYNREYIQNMLSQMTNAEKTRVLTLDFWTLWKELWGIVDLREDKYSNEGVHSRNKFDSLRAGVQCKGCTYTLATLVEDVSTQWAEAEWGFPKGRRNTQERDLDCAVREFCEETGFAPHQLTLLKNVAPFEETFTGSNLKSYRHKYYVACMDYGDTVTPSGAIQASEISALAFGTLAECMDRMRPYNVEKKRVLESVDRMLTSNLVVKCLP